ncbi:MAG TPA: FecR family protein [Candidatus Dormibacteraeota bacterium]|nr:FecR family protein [Candidatus Dormibacteraeota bacterium]
MSRARRRIGVVIIAALFLSFGATVTIAGISLARASAALTVFLGHVDVHKSGSGSAVLAHTGDALQPGDVVQTRAASRAAVSYPDGSTSRLDSDSALQVKTVSAGSNSAWNIELVQTAGKSWNRVHNLASGSSFNVGAPNATDVAVRGTEFEIIVENTNGKTLVRVDSWSGSVDVTAQGKTVNLVGGQSSSVQTGGAPSAAAPIPAADGRDAFAVFNRALDSAEGAVARMASGTLDPGRDSGDQDAGTADGLTDLQVTLSWPGSKFELTVTGPNTRRTISSDAPPITAVVTKAAAGEWHYVVKDVASVPGEPWSVIVTWRPRPPEVTDAQKRLEFWMTDHKGATGPGADAANLVSLDDGPFLKIEQFSANLAARFSKGSNLSNPMYILWLSGGMVIDHADSEVYVPPPGPGPATFLAITDVKFPDAPADSGAQPLKALLVFTKSGHDWKVAHSSFAVTTASMPPLAVGGDGFASTISAEHQTKYVLSAEAAATAYAADIQSLSQRGPSDPRFVDPDVSGFLKSVDQEKALGTTETTQWSADAASPTYAFQLADGSMLAFFTLAQTDTVASGARCVRQPSPPILTDPQHPINNVFLGVPRGAYGSIVDSSLATFAVVIPTRAAADQRVRAIASRSSLVSVNTTLCTFNDTPGTDTGFWGYI